MTKWRRTSTWIKWIHTSTSGGRWFSKFLNAVKVMQLQARPLAKVIVSRFVPPWVISPCLSCRSLGKYLNWHDPTNISSSKNLRWLNVCMQTCSRRLNTVFNLWSIQPLISMQCICIPSWLSAVSSPYTVEPMLKDHPAGHKNMVSQDRWSFVTGSVALKCGTFCQEYVGLQDGWSFMAVDSQDRFHCIAHCIIAHWLLC